MRFNAFCMFCIKLEALGGFINLLGRALWITVKSGHQGQYAGFSGNIV